MFNVEQGVVQGCSLSPILFSVFINGLLVAVQQAGLGIELSDGGKVGALLFADDFVGVSESGKELQRVIDVVHSYCRKWRLKANVSSNDFWKGFCRRQLELGGTGSAKGIEEYILGD